MVQPIPERIRQVPCQVIVVPPSGAGVNSMTAW